MIAESKILNCRLNNTFTRRFAEIKEKTGYDSDAECVRYLINIVYHVVDKDEDARFDYLTDKLEKAVIKKFKGKKIPSLDKQLANL